MCVCVYVRHAQKIAKLFFERAKHAAPVQIKYIIQKKIYQPLGPQNTPLIVAGGRYLFVTKPFVVTFQMLPVDN
jgi:hypothetical protein